MGYHDYTFGSIRHFKEGNMQVSNSPMWLIPNLLLVEERGKRAWVLLQVVRKGDEGKKRVPTHITLFSTDIELENRILRLRNRGV